MSDFDLIDDLFCKITDKKDSNGAASLNAEENVIVLIWHAAGIIDNGGFKYFFEQELDAEAVAKAYDTIGLPKAAEILRLALSLFPRSIPHTDWAERIKFIDKNPEPFEKLSEGFWDTKNEMRKKLADFIRNNQAKFEVP